MPPSEANDPLRSTDHEASPRPAGPDVSADGAPRALPDNAVTRTYVPGRATEPAGTGPVPARESISVPGYQIEAVLGRGGMGVVYKARHLALKRTVALKMVLAGGHASPEELARFRIEAEAVARLQHPNIVQIHEVGEADGLPYCALEFVEGGNLARKIAGQPMPARVAAQLVEAVARAMQLAHSRNVVHRDLKPANVLLATDGTPKISDFGLARQTDSDSGETQSGAVMGTPSYMAPEQASGRAHEAGPAADIYALGAILYECLTGRPPFKGQTPVETLDQVRTQEPVPPSQRQAGVPRDLETICLKCLRKEPEKRYASAAELADDLVRYQHGEPIRARPVGGMERCVKWVKRNPVVAGAALAVLLALVGGLTVSLLKYREAEAARLAEADRVKERDAALDKADAALEESNYQLDSSNFLLAVAAYNNREVYQARLRLDRIQAKHRGWEWHYLRRQATGGIFTLFGHTRAVSSVAFSPDGTRIVTGSIDQTAKVWDARTGTPQLELKGHTHWLMSVAFSPDGTRIVTGGFDQTAKVWDARTGTPQLELKGHTGSVQGVAFSPDGTRLVTGSRDQTAKVWDARTGKPQLELKGHTGWVNGVAFSPDGTRLVTGSNDQTAKVWDARTGTPLLELKGHTSAVIKVAFSPDGTRLVTGSYDRTAKVWDARIGTPQLELKGHTGDVASVAFSPDGTRILTGSWDQTARVWDARTGTPQLELKGHTDAVNSVAFSPDGTRIVTGSYDHTAKVWDARIGTPQLELKGHTGEVSRVAFSPDGTRLVTGSYDQTARVWDARTGTLQLELKGHTSAVSSVAFSPDGTRILTGSHDGTAKVWDARTGTPQLELKGHTNQVWSVAFSPDGTRIVTGSLDQTAKVWDAQTGKPQLELKGYTAGVRSVAFSPDGTRIATGSNDPTARVWDARTGTPQLELKGHTNQVWSVAFSPDGTRILTGSLDQTAKVWDARTGTPQLELKGHTSAVMSVAFSPDGTRIVTGSGDQTAKVWDARTGTPQLELKGHTYQVWSVAFSPDGTRIVTGSLDQTAKVWNARTDTHQLELKGHKGWVISMAFSPGGTRLVTGSHDGTARVWDARTGTPQLELKGHELWVNSVAFSPDGTRIVTGGDDGTAKVWDARTGTPLLELKGHTGAVSSVAFSPDGTRIVTGSYDQTAKVWDARTGTPLLELKGHTDWVKSVAFSPDGTRIVTGSDDRTAKVWDARTGQELRGEPIPPTIANHGISPDGRFFAHPCGDLVEVVSLQPDEEELAYRLVHTQPNVWRYREGYEAARAARDDFAARFYLNLLPPPEQKMIEAQAAADREIAAGRTPDALVYLVTVSAARPDDTRLALRVACLQAWFGQDNELADTRGRALESARGTFDPSKWAHLARICCLRPTPDTTRREAALALARKAVEHAKEDFSVKLTLGMAEYRSGHFAEADAALLAVANGARNNPLVAGTATFYRAMSLFRQGKENEARKLATEAAAQMKPLPKDDRNPLAGGASPDDLLLWLACKEAKGLIPFDAAPAPSQRK
jgi:WD40 repeat protein